MEVDSHRNQVSISLFKKKKRKISGTHKFNFRSPISDSN